MDEQHPLTDVGWDERVARAYEEAVDEQADGSHPLDPGRVVRVERAPKAQGFVASAIVRMATGEALVTSTSALPAVGDWVGVRVVDDGVRLLDVLVPRRSELTRQDPASEHDEQVLAANVDFVLIVAPGDRLRVARIERELLVAWQSGAQPVVVLTKVDLLDDPDETLGDLRDRLVGATVLPVSSRSGEGVEAVGTMLRPSATAVLFGPSGAGKSTLANALLGGEVLATGDVREGDRRGRHTTTSRQLVAVPGGGVLIDTPGIRSLGVWQGEEGLAAAFADVATLAERCRFRDCTHVHEPGCAIRAAVEAAELDADRVESYRKLQREVLHAEHAHDAAYQRQQKDRWRAVTKANRKRPPKR